jgi:hypothetical protein
MHFSSSFKVNVIIIPKNTFKGCTESTESKDKKQEIYNNLLALYIPMII